ncbi:MAG TPA: glycoside hydrolase family 2 TIM barrel-domain containing protein [Candidatus Acidoferrum sp.]|nr:glycoside hydrolase family 2 TIM barrel-domain containing protein [Candidatus Acidoferrum sp.]
MKRLKPFAAWACLNVALVAHGAEAPYQPPASPRGTFNFNPGWKFIRADVTNADRIDFDDSHWAVVSTPHTYNDIDSYAHIISHSGGDRYPYAGIAWYRKHFQLPADAQNGKVFLEFEGLKQAGRFWVNGQFAGKYENGVTPCGLDLTPFVKFGDVDNVIAVKVDNRNDYKEEATGTEFEWMGRAFNPNYGGLNRNVRLHLTGRVYQTLPLYENLKTTGIYTYPSNFDIKNKTCDVHVESQVRNESGDPQSVTLSVAVVDANGKVCATFESEASDLVSGQTETFKAAGKLADAKFWSDADPHLYDVYTQLTVDGKVVDVCRTRTGFRQTEFKGGAGTGGVYMNDKFVWLTGYSQRSTDDWAGLGQAYPDWMHDYNAQLIRASHANYLRWMHISPQTADVRACDAAGIIEICPAGDKEKDAAGRQWEQRVEVMRDAMIYFRNHPSILFWEAGNNSITPEHLQQMVDLRKEWDPHGGRAMGCRTLNDEASTPIAEWFGVMIGQDPRTDQLTNRTALFRAYSTERRDRAPLLETEDFRDEAARRFWDDYSARETSSSGTSRQGPGFISRAEPPRFGFKPGPNDVYHWNSETFCLAAAVRYHDYWINRISNPDPAHSKWSGYASIYWSDSNADGRQDSSEVCRVSGKVDSVRLPKQAFYVYRVMQNPEPDLHVIGHWNYPANTVKTVYVAANHCDAVELFVSGRPIGATNRPCDFVDIYNGENKQLGDTGYLFAFPAVRFEPGTVKATGRAGNKIVAQDEIETAGEPKKLRLTPHVGPGGLQADGSDVAFFDVEVVDVQGRRCPTDEAQVDFKLDGPATWRGGYNSGITNSINNLYLNTECGINRVAIRSSLQPGPITLTANRAGLESATARIESRPVSLKDGLLP